MKPQFPEINYTGAQLYLLVYILSMAAFVKHRQGWVVVKETVWPMKPKIFTIWPHIEFADPHFTVLIMRYYINWFSDIKEINPIWCCPKFFHMLLDSKIFPSIFTSLFLRDTEELISFYCDVFVWLWYQKNTGLVDELQSLSSFILWMSLKISIISLNIWWKLPVKPSGPGIFFMGQLF